MADRETAAPLRRCTTRVGRKTEITLDAPCAPAQLGVACCPCRGHTAEAEYAAVVETVRRGLSGEPGLLLEPLERRMDALAQQERFEEAALTRDRLGALTRVLRRAQTLAWLSTSGAMNVAVADGVVSFRDGRLLLGGNEPNLFDAAAGGSEIDLTGPPPVPAHLDRRRSDELLIVARWLDRDAPIAAAS